MQYKDKVPTYAEAKMGNTSGITHHICIDTGSAISIIDSAYVRKYLPHVTIHPSSTIRLKGIGYNSTSGWISTSLHFLNLKDLDKHQHMLERRDNEVDFVGSNNIAVIDQPKAFEDLSLDNKTQEHTNNQGYDGNVIANHSNNVDLVSLFFGLLHYPFDAFSNQDSFNIHDTPFTFEHTTGSSRGPLNTSFVDALHKSCAIQHLAAETADAASLLDLQSAARVDTNGMSPSSSFFDDVSICRQPFYFGTYRLRYFSQP
jgi:hypothetical protein